MANEMGIGKLKVMTYNVLEGLQDQRRRSNFIEYIKASDVDVLALQELNGLQDQDLIGIAASYGHSYAVQLKTSGYPVGITARRPITLVKKLRFGFHHGVLHVRIQGLNFYIVHFSPLSSVKRTKEAHRLIQYIHRQSSDPADPSIILGDFNSHSFTDAVRLEQLQLADTFDAKNLMDGKISFEAIRTLTDFGFIDSYDYLNSDDARVAATYPVDRIKTHGERIDYIFVSGSLASKLSSSRIDSSSHTALISDHFPVITCLDFSK
ncbi:MAG: endonuclease/exonuclease/phosphatase family protein [Lachnospiraceae bacterium]